MAEPDVRQLVSELHPLEHAVLSVLKSGRPLWDHELGREAGMDESRLSMALGWLLAKGIVDEREMASHRLVSLTDLGRRYARDQIPEKRIISQLQAGTSLTVQSLRQSGGMDPSEVSTAMGNLKQYSLVKIGEGGRLILAEGDWPAFVSEGLVPLLAELSRSSEPVRLEELPGGQRSFLEEDLEKRWKTRGVLKVQEKKSKRLGLTELGARVALALAPEAPAGEEVTRLTPEMLKGGLWRDKAFRRFNLGLKPPRILVGKKHAYREFLDRVKDKLVGMGFEEMRGPLVETEFWDMDALFMPQFHPARDIHDVYFVKEPQFAREVPEPYLTQVGQTHEAGWKTGSVGWRYPFDPQRAGRLVLRSQGTAVSARTLAGDGPAQGPKVPGKYFSIARCFRYDQVDATHACDFFQVEGIVLGESIHFRTLLGLLRLFAMELARASRIKFLPAYFPFTEPSVEMHVEHPDLGWMELGGAGLFRPEVTRPLGVEVPVIAWGLGLDRMAMVALEISDIRDLFSTDLDLIRSRRMKT